MTEINQIKINKISEQLKYEINKLDNTKLKEYLKYSLELTNLRNKILFMKDKLPLINLKMMMRKTIGEIESPKYNLLDFCLDLDSNINTRDVKVDELTKKLDSLLLQVNIKCDEIYHPLYSLIVESGDGLECDLFDIDDVIGDFQRVNNELLGIYEYELSSNNNDIDCYLRDINVSNPDLNSDSNGSDSTDEDIDEINFIDDEDDNEDKIEYIISNS